MPCAIYRTPINRPRSETNQRNDQGFLRRHKRAACARIPPSVLRVGAALRDPATPMSRLATCASGKFPDAVEAPLACARAAGKHMADLFDREERVTRVTRRFLSA